MIKVKRINDYLQVKFDYSEENLSKIKTFIKREWKPEKKVWIIPYNEGNIAKLKKLFYNEKNFKIIENGNPKQINESLIKKFEEELILKGYTNKTRKNYLGHLKRFANYYKKDLEKVTANEIRDYLIMIHNEEKTLAYASQTISSLKFFFNHILRKLEVIENVPRPKKEKKLPSVFSSEEVLRLLGSINNLKHQAIMFIVYSAGLRVGEVIRLKIEDIDSNRMLIHVKQGKGRKDRYTLLSKATLDILREYVKKYRPEMWLFPGDDEKKFITDRTVQRVFEKAKEKAGIIKTASVHTLRHSFATHLLEGGD